MRSPGLFLSNGVKTRYSSGALANYTSWPQNHAMKGRLVFLLLLAILIFRSQGHPEELLEE